MTTEIHVRAQEIAHQHTSACRNRPAAMAVGHGDACTKLARIISEAMDEAYENGFHAALKEKP